MKKRGIIAKCWLEDGFERQLTDNPKKTLRAGGIPVPEDSKVVVVKNTDNLFHLVLTPPPGPISKEHQRLHDIRTEEKHFGIFPGTKLTSITNGKYIKE